MLGELQADGRYRSRAAVGIDQLLDSLPQSLDTSSVKKPREKREFPMVPRVEGSLPSLGSLAIHSGNVFLGRVAGVAESFYQPNSRRQWTSYVVEVVREFKSSRPQPVRLVRILWPGGYLNGGQVWKYPLLEVGGDYILFTNAAPRIVGNEGERQLVEDHGEEAVTQRGWGWSGFGLMRVRAGRVLPAFPEVEAQLQQHLAAGGKMPVLNVATKQPIPAWGLPLEEYLRHLDLATQ